ncbi:unnamed protein product [Vitrella brassicaformis CCMP3155]|uniref:Uncharacterized protein n=1 Tax=Vitrella brassicaformis (strain CCMP3155) TaxID=1169540 RepID=A0A0G4ECJ9_VITBC|nr:unnamed protein product [Vitrella brassicaformis CCMP3155]|eukprot:CEL93699.1 unnamed protein product [Vitrella brassicaformis CCMP3155]
MDDADSPLFKSLPASAAASSSSNESGSVPSYLKLYRKCRHSRRQPPRAPPPTRRRTQTDYFSAASNGREAPERQVLERASEARHNFHRTLQQLGRAAFQPTAALDDPAITTFLEKVRPRPPLVLNSRPPSPMPGSSHDPSARDKYTICRYPRDDFWCTHFVDRHPLPPRSASAFSPIRQPAVRWEALSLAEPVDGMRILSVRSRNTGRFLYKQRTDSIVLWGSGSSCDGDIQQRTKGQYDDEKRPCERDGGKCLLLERTQDDEVFDPRFSDLRASVRVLDRWIESLPRRLRDPSALPPLSSIYPPPQAASPPSSAKSPLRETPAQHQQMPARFTRKRKPDIRPHRQARIQPSLPAPGPKGDPSPLFHYDKPTDVYVPVPAPHQQTTKKEDKLWERIESLPDSDMAPSVEAPDGKGQPRQGEDRLKVIDELENGQKLMVREESGEMDQNDTCFPCC